MVFLERKPTWVSEEKVARLKSKAELDKFGTVSRKNQLIEALYSERKPSIYDVPSKELPVVKSIFSVDKSSLLPGAELVDYYEHPIAIQGELFGYVDYTGIVYLDRLDQMVNGIWRTNFSVKVFDNQRMSQFYFCPRHPFCVLVGSSQELWEVDLPTNTLTSHYKFPDIRSVATESSMDVTLIGRINRLTMVDKRIEGGRVQSLPASDAIKILSRFPYVVAGQNSDSLLVYDARRMDRPLYEHKEFKAAVRALAWDTTNSSYFYAGGGTADRTIKLYSLANGTLQQTIDSRAQVMDIHTLATGQILSVHGYSPNKQDENAQPDQNLFETEMIAPSPSGRGLKNRVILWNQTADGLRQKEELFLSGEENNRPLFSAMVDGTLYVGSPKYENMITEMDAIKVDLSAKKRKHSIFDTIR